MGSNIKQFVAQLDEFNKTKVPVDYAILKRKVTLFCLTGVVMKTPVDKGTARANWQVTLGIPSEKIFSKVDKTGGKTITLGLTKTSTSSFGAFDDVHITNNLPYIKVLEEGGFVPTDPGPSKDRRRHRRGRTWVKGGFSVQAPSGMVAITLKEARATTFTG